MVIDKVKRARRLNLESSCLNPEIKRFPNQKQFKSKFSGVNHRMIIKINTVSTPLVQDIFEK